MTLKQQTHETTLSQAGSNVISRHTVPLCSEMTKITDNCLLQVQTPRHVQRGADVWELCRLLFQFKSKPLRSNIPATTQINSFLAFFFFPQSPCKSNFKIAFFFSFFFVLVCPAWTHKFSFRCSCIGIFFTTILLFNTDGKIFRLIEIIGKLNKLVGQRLFSFFLYFCCFYLKHKMLQNENTLCCKNTYKVSLFIISHIVLITIMIQCQCSNKLVENPNLVM